MEESGLATVIASPNINVTSETETDANGEVGSVDNTESASNTPTWYLADEIPGVGDKPDWFNDGTFKNVTEQARAQGELRKKLGEFTGAPDDGYDIAVNDEFDGVEFDYDDPLLNEFAQMSRDANMSQTHFNKMLNLVVHHNQEAEQQVQHENQEFWKSELETLGSNGVEQLKVLDQWGKNNLSDDLYPSFREMATTANSIKILQLLKEKSVPVPLQNEFSPARLDRQDIRTKMADKRYQTDINYQKQVDAMAKELYGN